MAPNKCRLAASTLTTLVLLGIFLAMSKNEIERYGEHHTATSTDTKMETEIEFPALTICDNHYRHGDVVRDLNMPRNPFASLLEVRIDPIYE